MRKSQVSILVLVLLFAISQLCYAADNTVTIIAEGTYIMGDGETASAAELRAFENAKRSAIEQAGVYVESYSQTKNLQLSKDEVTVISSGLVQATVIDKKRTIEGESGFRFWCKVSCIIKIDSIADMKARLSDKKLIAQYIELQANDAKIQEELADLKAQLQNATTDTAKKAAEAKIAQNEQQSSIQDMLERAHQLGVAGDYDTAISICTQILTKESNVDAYYLRGVAYGEKGQYVQANADFSQIIKLEPDFADAYFLRGLTNNGIGQYDQAIADYSQAIKLKPDEVDAYINRGSIYDKKNQLDQAIADFSQAIKLKPNEIEAYFKRGLVYGKKDKLDQAVADFSQVIKLKPDYADAYYNRGVAYRLENQNDQAIADYSNTLKLKPDYVDAYYDRGNAYFELDLYDQAIVDFTQTIKLKPDYAEAYYFRGCAYGAKHQYGQAIYDFSQAIKLRPNYALAYYSRSLAYGLNEQYSRSLEDLRMVRQLDYALFMKAPKGIRDMCQ